MAKSLEDIVNDLIDEGVSEKKANKILDEYVKKQAAARTEGIQTKGGVFNPEFGGPVSMSEMAEVTPEEMDIARKSAKALEEYEKVNEPESIKAASKQTKTPVEKIRRAVTKSAVESGTPLNVDKFVKTKELESTFAPVLEKEAIRENLRQRYASGLGSAAKQAEPVVEAISDAEKYSSVKPIFSPLEENLEALSKLPADVKDKVLSSLLKGKTSAINLLTKGAKIAAPIQTVLSGAEASKAGSELLGDENLSTKQKFGKAAKLFGGSAMASVLPMEIMSAGAATPVAIPVGLGGAALYGLGEYLDDSEQPLVSPAPIKEETTPTSKASTIDVMDKVDQKDLPQILEKNRPPVDEVKQYVIQQAKERGEDASLALAQMAQESSFNPFAVSKEGARGLGQHFPRAFTDAQSIDKKGTLKNLSYDEAMQPENWKAQVDAFFDYRDWLKKNRNPKNEEEFIKFYHAGSKDPQYYNTPDNIEYFDQISKRKPRYEKELTNMNQLTEEEQELDRSPSSVNVSPEEKADALRRLKAFLTASSDNLGEENAPLSFGPVPSAEEYDKYRQDQQKLMELKDKYEYLKGLKKTPYERPELTTTPTAASSETAPATPELEAIQKMAEAQSTLQDQLKEAQEQRKRDILIGSLGKSFMPIVAGLSGLASRSKVETPEGSAFDEMIKQAGLPITELKEKIALEKDDPNSDASKMLRKIAEEDVKRATGQTVNFGNMSYNQLTEVFPQLSRMAERIEIAKLKREDAAKTKETENQAKANTAFRKDLITYRGNSAARVAAENQLRISNALSLAERGQDLTPQEIQLLATEISRVAQGSAPTVSGIKEIVPRSLRAELAKVSSFLLNKPEPAKANDFIKRNISYLKEMSKNSNRVLHEFQGNIAAGYLNRLHPEDKRDFFLQFPQVAVYTKLSREALQKYANEHKISFDEAENILNERILKKELADE
jgi:hypothetical protein